MLTWKDDNELFALMRRYLYSAVLGDILDQLHHYHQFLPQRLQPLQADMVLAGRAMPVLEQDISAEAIHGASVKPDKPFGLMLDALDGLQPNEVYLCAGASPEYALVGELMCARMKSLGAAGSVAVGFHRDSAGILRLGFPCFSYGAYSQDQAPRGQVVDYRVPIDIAGVRVCPGDLIFGDRDGVLVIPKALEQEVLCAAYEKATGEKTVANAIQAGMSAKTAFETYGIL